MTKLTSHEIVKLECFMDPTEHIVVTDFEWYWSFHDHKDAQICRLFCGVYIIGYTKEHGDQQKLFDEIDLEQAR
jgi:hypothetical protein